MKIEQKELDLGLKKARGIVNDASVLEQLRAFYIKPNLDGTSYIAGSDGIMTLLTSVKVEDTGDCDEEQFAVPSDKLQLLVRNTDKPIHFFVNGQPTIDIQTGNSNLKIAKHDMDSDFINFDVMEIKEEEYEDVVKADDLKFILSSLLPIVSNSSPDLTYRTIYFDKTKAYACDGTVVCYIEFPTNKEYVISSKAVRQIHDLLANSTTELIHLKRIDDDTSILLRTSEDTLTFRLLDNELFDIDSLLESKSAGKIVLETKEVIFAINRARITSEEDNVEFEVTPTQMKIFSETAIGELTNDHVDVLKEKLNGQTIKFNLLSTELLKLMRLMRTELVVFDFDIESGRLRITDSEKKAVAIMSMDVI